MSENGVLQLTRRYAAEVARGFERAPAEFAAALATAAALSYLLELDAPSPEAWVEIALTALLMVVAAWTGTFLHALGRWSLRTRWLVTFAGAVAAGLYGHFVLDTAREAEAWRAFMLAVAGLLWVLSLPVFARASDDPVEQLRVIDGRLLLRTLAAGLYGLALFAGLALAVAAVNSLFELKLEGEIYGHVFGWIAFALVPCVIFSGLDEYTRPLHQQSAAAPVIRRITVYLVLPLLALYFTILYAYAVRIGVTGELPKNLVSPMVLAAGVLGGVALLLFDPRPLQSGAARALRLAPLLFLPLALLGAWALLQRIDQYGWTEFRVLRLAGLGALAALAVGGTIQVIRRRALALHVIPLALALFFLLIAVGPWSAVSISRRSQQARLAEALAAAGIRPDVAAAAPRPRTISAELYDRLQGSAGYLLAHYGEESLPPALRRYAHSSDRWIEFGALLGLERDRDITDDARDFGYASLPHGVAAPTTGADLYRIEYPGMSGAPGPRLVVDQQGTQLRLTVGQELLSADIASLEQLRGSGRRPPRSSNTQPAELVLPLVNASGVRRGELVLLDVQLDFDSAGMKVQRFSGLVLLTRPR